MAVLSNLLVPPSGDELDRYLLGELSPADRQVLELRLELYPEAKQRLAQITFQRQMLSGTQLHISADLTDPADKATADLVAEKHETQLPPGQKRDSAAQHRRAKQKRVAGALESMKEQRPSSEEVFKLVKWLGYGGFANTCLAQVLDPYLVKQYGTDRVALKIPIGKENALLLRREIEFNALLHLHLKQIESKYLVRYLGFEAFQGDVVMVMEYIAGGSLRERLGKGGKQNVLPLAESLHIITCVLKGLAYLHTQQVCHRDLKPENILLTENIAKVADLGLARLQSPEMRATGPAGSLYYMSPEALANRDLSPRVDVWSAGVVLYEMLTGCLPFGDSKTPFATLYDLIAKSRHASATEVRRDVPQALSDIIDKALSKNPDDRYPAAQEMLEDIESFQGNNISSMHSFRDELARMWESIHNAVYDNSLEAKLRNLVARYPDVPDAYQCLGELYSRNARYRDAIRVFEHGLARQPQSAILHWDLALALIENGDRTAALDHIKLATAIGLDENLLRYAHSRLHSLEVVENPSLTLPPGS